MTLGEQIATRRKALGITQRGLARRAQITDVAVRGIESGRIHGPRFGVVVILAEILGLRLDDLAAAVGQGERRPYVRQSIVSAKTIQGKDAENA